VLPIYIQRGDISQALSTTMATLGTPRDVTLQEDRIECLLPMDEVTNQCWYAWARRE